jgi:exosortase
MDITVKNQPILMDESSFESLKLENAAANGRPAPQAGTGKAISLHLLGDVIPYAFSFALLVAISWPMLTWWYWEYTRPESYYSHAPLIPIMCGFMLWHRLPLLKAVEKKAYWPAIFLLVPSLALLVLSVKEDMRAVQSTAFLITIWSSVLLALGPRFFKAAWFQLFFLILMAPLPAPLLNDSTLHFQMWSTMFAAKILSVTGFSNTQIGNVIHIDNYTMDVDVPCSGFKTLLALVTFNAFLANMLDGSFGRRLALFILCLPLALLINGVRIALIGMVGECIGFQAAHVFHDYSGLLTLTLGFMLLFTIARTLGCRKFAGLDIF